MDNIKKQKEHFEKISHQYIESRQNLNHLMFKDLMWKFFLKDKTIGDNIAVLEPMCGYAEGKSILEKCAGLKIDYTGFDICENIINHVKQGNPSINVSLMDITKYNSKDSYDLIILIGGLHHIYSCAFDVVKKLYFALRKDGYFISLEPTHNLFLLKKIREHIYKNNEIFEDTTEKAFDLSELNRIFQENQFRLVDQIYPGLISYILYYNPDAFPALNIGNTSLVKFTFNIEKWFFRRFIGRNLSFATLSMWQKA